MRSRWLAPGAPRGIHLSWSEDPTSTLTVTWQSPGPGGPARVAWRTAAAPVREVRGTTRPVPGSPWHQHRVVLRGIAPDAEVLYRVGAAAAPAGEAGAGWHRARTAPAASLDAVFFCDVGIAGRPDGTTADVEAVVDAIARDRPRLLLGGGDYASASRDPRFRDPAEAADRWFEQMQRLLARAPFMATYGNHESGLGERVGEWAARFAHPPGAADGLSYSFDVGPAHFVSLFAPGRPPPADHLRWLEDDLAGERARRAAWRIVFQHAPVFAHGTAHPARPDVAALRSRFERLGVDLHLSGHDQSYERTHPLGPWGAVAPLSRGDGGQRYAAGRGVLYAKVSPAGKRSERGRDFSRLAGDAASGIASRSDACHHWARIRVRADALEVRIAGLAGGGSRVRQVDAFALDRSG